MAKQIGNGKRDVHITGGSKMPKHQKGKRDGARDESVFRVVHVLTETRSVAECVAACNMWSEDVRVVLELCKRKFQGDQAIRDLVEYAQVFEPELREACATLEFLGLAVPDDESPFGWRSTARLMDYIARPKTKQKLKRLCEYDLMSHLLHDCVYGYDSDRGEGSIFTGILLRAAGLLDCDDDTCWVTADLHGLFAMAYYRKRDSDGLFLFPENLGRVRMNLSRYDAET